MERLELAPLYNVVGKESKGTFLGADDFTLGSEEPSQYCYLAPYPLWLRYIVDSCNVCRRTVVLRNILCPLAHVS
jgi:hypothetical protein